MSNHAAGHYIDKCKDCGTIVGQCKCMAKEKTVRYVTCHTCTPQPEKPKPRPITITLKSVDAKGTVQAATPGPNGVVNLVATFQELEVLIEFGDKSNTRAILEHVDMTIKGYGADTTHKG